MGISRTSKTPLSVYLSQHGIKVVNVPLYGEPRVEKIPLERDRVWLPLELGSEGELTPVDYQMTFTRAGQTIKREINVTVSREFEAIDICEFPL